MSIIYRKSKSINRVTYFDNQVSSILSPKQDVIPEVVEPIFPSGGIIAYTMPNAPLGWLVCDGAEINRYSYKELFAIIGTTFGSGDGSTTFNLPNYQGAFLRGTGTGGGYSGPAANTSQAHATQTHNHTATTTITDPGHTHTQTNYNDDYNNSSTAGQIGLGFSKDAGIDSPVVNTNISQSNTGVTASTTVANSTVSVNANETRPYNFGVYWIIKT